MKNDRPIHPATGLRAETFGIGTYTDGERRFPALVLPAGEVIDVSAHYIDTHAIFDDWDRSFDALHRLAEPGNTTHRFESLRPLQPIPRPNLMRAGSNYKTHNAQMMTNLKAYQHLRHPGESNESFYARNLAAMEVRAREGTPFLYAGLHSSMVGARDDYQMPVLGENNEYECELALVLGRRGRYATLEQAQSMIAAYFVANDLGTVDVFRRTDIPWGFDWLHKNQPGGAVCGPFVVPAQFVKWDELQIVFKVNGEAKQDWPTNDMIFSPAHLVAYASERLALQPGDVIMTGSPPGNGSHHGRFLQEGDVIQGEVTGLGQHINKVVREPKPDHPLVFGLWKNS